MVEQGNKVLKMRIGRGSSDAANHRLIVCIMA
jgi:hypothetical protein